MATFLLNALGKPLINRAAQPNLNDGDEIAWLKRKLLDRNVTARWQERERTLEMARDDFVEAIEMIESKIANNKTVKFDDHSEAVERAFDLLRSENIDKLAKVVFDYDALWTDEIIRKFNDAYRGFKDSWLDTAHVHFYYRLSALRMAFFCDVYHRLFVDKNLQQFKVNQYWAYVLPKLARSIHKPNIISRILPKCIRKGNDVNNVHLQKFATEMLRFTDLEPDEIVQIKCDQQFEYVRELDRKEKTNVSDWLQDTRDRQLSPHVQLLTIIKQPTAIADSMIKAYYRNRFAKYNPFYFPLKYQFEMKNWIPICLKVKGDSQKQEKEWFQLVDERLKTHGLVAIIGILLQLFARETLAYLSITLMLISTGDPGAGKTILTKKIAFDYATSNSDNKKWINKYDIVLLAEFRATSDAKVDNDIIGMALYGLKKMIDKQLSSSVGKLIKDNRDKCKLLIILDGYDEAMNRQCPQLDDALDDNEHDRLPFDLIVTSRPSRVINRTDNITFLQIVGFDSDDKQHKYIEKHFERHKDKNNQIELVKSKIKNNRSYQEMAKTPLLLAFICLVHSHLVSGTRVELYENVVRWFIRRKIDVNLAAALQPSDSNYLISSNKDQIDAQTADAIANEWSDNLEQIKRLGYLSCWLLSKKLYQFDSTAINKLQPNNINSRLFTKIGLLGSDTQGPISKPTTKYQFAHRTLQEYFATMFIVKWEDEWIRNGIKYEKVKELLMWNENKNTFLSDELSKFIIEILLAKRDSKYIKSVQQYLIKIKKILFEIHSNDIDESWKQINYINDILQKCPNIEEVIIDLHKISVNNTIELKLPNIDNIEVVISNGLFSNNQSNIISISGRNQIKINIDKCDLSLSGLKLFAEYINNNAKRFNSIRLYNISLTEADMININKLKSIYFKQYCGYLEIDNLQLNCTQSTEYLNTYIINLSILQLFFGIEKLTLELPRNDEMNDNSYLLQQSIEYSSNMTNLSTLNLFFNDDNTSISKTYWTCINSILQKCPNIRKIEIGLFKLHNITIDEPIDLHFLSLEHHIELVIWNVTFTDNDSNMICINGKVQQINIQFWNCKYSYRRLISFANYIDQNSQLFNKIEFTRVSDKDIFDAVFKNTKFDHIAIKQSESDECSIVKRRQI